MHFISMVLLGIMFFFEAHGTVLVQRDGGSPELTQDQYLSYYFGRVRTNSYNTVTYNLTNTGATDLRVERITISGMFYDARTNCPSVLAPRQQCRTRISYWPSFEGFHSGRLIWYTSDNDVVLDLLGEAVKF